jgi:hypothetical protein
MRSYRLTVTNVSANDVASLMLVLKGSTPWDRVQRGIARKLIRECQRILHDSWARKAGPIIRRAGGRTTVIDPSAPKRSRVKS